MNDAARTTGGEPRWQWARDSLAIAAGMVAFAYFASLLAHAAGGQDPLNATRVPLPWVPLGIAVGALFSRGYNRWPGAFVGVIGTTLLVANFPPAATIAQATSATLSALGIVWLLRAWRVNVSIERWQDPLLLWFAAALGATVMAGVAGTAVIAAAGMQAQRVGPGLLRNFVDAQGRPIYGMPLFWLIACWWANWTSGVALVVPVVQQLNRATWRSLAHRPLDLLVVALSLVGWGFAAFAPLPWVASLPLCLVALVLVAWAAIRFGSSGASFIPLVLALIETVAFITGRGPLQARPQEAIVAVWTFVTIVALLGMLITSLLAERNTAARRQGASEARYRVLFEASPRALWVHDQASQRILMVNDAAVKIYGYDRAQFQDLLVRDLEADDASAWRQIDGVPAQQDEGDHRHRTRSGEIIEVELHAEPIEFDGRPARLVFSDDVTDRNRLRGALLDAADEAERQLGRELHDGLCQDLVALSLIAHSEKARLKNGGTPDPKGLDLIESVALQAIENCRAIARGLSALAETGGDLRDALRRLPNRFRHQGPPIITATIRGEAPLALPEGARDHIFRVAQEALTNAVKHANAQRIEIVLEVSEKAVILTVRDDGRGLPHESPPNGGLGRASMRHRAAAIGAQLYVSGVRGGGTEVRLECPQQRAQARQERRWG